MYGSAISSSKFGWEFQYNIRLFKLDFFDVIRIVKKQIEAWRAVCRNHNKPVMSWLLSVMVSLSIQNIVKVLPKLSHKASSTMHWYKRFPNAQILRLNESSWSGFLTSSKYNPHSFIGKNTHCSFAMRQIFLVHVWSIFTVAVFQLSVNSCPSSLLSRNSFKMITDELASPSIEIFKSAAPSSVLIVNGVYVLVVELVFWVKILNNNRFGSVTICPIN